MRANSSCTNDGPHMNIQITSMSRSTSPLKPTHQLNNDLIFDDHTSQFHNPVRIRRQIGMGSHVTKKIVPITNMGLKLQNVKQKQMPF